MGERSACALNFVSAYLALPGARSREGSRDRSLRIAVVRTVARARRLVEGRNARQSRVLVADLQARKRGLGLLSRAGRAALRLRGAAPVGADLEREARPVSLLRGDLDRFLEADLLNQVLRDRESDSAA